MAQWQKGQSGNPGGRPPKVVEDARQSVLLKLFDEAAESGVVKAMIRGAKKGDVSAATWLWDRKYGKVVEKRELSGPDGGPLSIREVIIEVPAGESLDGDTSE